MIALGWKMLQQSVVRVGLLVAFVSILSLSNAKADLIYQFEFGQALYSASPNERVAVEIFLREYVTGTSVSRFSIGNDNGLYSIGAKISFSSTDPNGPAAPLGFSDVELDSNFDLATAGVTVDYVRNEISILAFAQAGALPYLETSADPTNPNRYSFRIATLFFNMSNQPTAPTDLVIGKLDSGFPDNTLIVNADPGNGLFPIMGIDDVVQGDFSTLSSVPEPSTVLLVMTAMLGWIPVRMRRKRHALASE